MIPVYRILNCEIPFYGGFHCDSLLQRIACDSFMQRVTLWFPFAKDYIDNLFYKGLHVIPFYRRLQCDSFLKRIALSCQIWPIKNILTTPNTEDDIVIHLLQRIALWSIRTKDCMVIPFYRGLHCDSLLQRWHCEALLKRIALRSPSAEDYVAIPFCKELHCQPL